jgi:prepilin-type processing-associated H-X9-DG protein
MNVGCTIGSFSDGLSNTVGFAEVKVFGTYLLGSGSFPLNTPPPADPAALVALGGSLKTDVTHTGWTEGQTFQTGLTFVFPPNTQVPFVSNGTTYDVDYVSSRDGSSATKLSYAAMTARSFHGGRVVNVLFMDGSVRAVKSTVSQAAWWAAGSRNGGEVFSLD